MTSAFELVVLLQLKAMEEALKRKYGPGVLVDDSDSGDSHDEPDQLFPKQVHRMGLGRGYASAAAAKATLLAERSRRKQQQKKCATHATIGQFGQMTMMASGDWLQGPCGSQRRKQPAFCRGLASLASATLDMPGGPTKFRSMNRYGRKRERSKKIPKTIPSAQDTQQLAAEIVPPPNVDASTALPDHASPHPGSTRVRIDTPVVTEKELNEIRACEQAALDKIALTPATERKIRWFEDPTTDSATASVTEPAAPYIIVELAAVNNLISVLSCNTCSGSAKLVRSNQDYGLATKLTVVCEMCGEVASGWSSPRIEGPKTCNPFEVNILAMHAMLSTGNSQTAMNDIFSAMGLSRRRMHKKHFSST
ncbi:hypothetical protein HPB49_006097 [Dermacentor silvarum]|uniref:Uncharacterized protein n=1 Tax=Dermacentor silvarum TaxID=543639 RepID=A0ACB8DW33_DERSI|nr:hypothetical protein HPB49_006097 [Dermacentor silvarum]